MQTSLDCSHGIPKQIFRKRGSCSSFLQSNLPKNSTWYHYISSVSFLIRLWSFQTSQMSYFGAYSCSACKPIFRNHSTRIVEFVPWCECRFSQFHHTKITVFTAIHVVPQSWTQRLTGAQVPQPIYCFITSMVLLLIPYYWGPGRKLMCKRDGHSIVRTVIHITVAVLEWRVSPKDHRV